MDKELQLLIDELKDSNMVIWDEHVDNEGGVEAGAKAALKARFSSFLESGALKSVDDLEYKIVDVKNLPEHELYSYRKAVRVKGIKK